MKVQVGFGTDIGRKRQQNQDTGGTFPELGLFIVADGMGGHRGGETASSMAVDIIPEMIKQYKEKNIFKPREALIQSIIQANAEIYARAVEDPTLQGMGTTTTALLLQETNNEIRAYIGHVGDSRCYYFRDGCLWQLTRDHSLVQEKLRAGLITREELKTDRMKNVITRSVGFEPEVEVETYEMTAKIEDVFVICSDGLSGLLEDKAITSLLTKRLQNPNRSEEYPVEKLVGELIQSANENGGDDNITAIIVKLKS